MLSVGEEPRVDTCHVSRRGERRELRVATRGHVKVSGSRAALTIASPSAEQKTSEYF